MALSRITKIAPGGSNTFAVAFALGYGDEADVTARVGNEVDGLGAPVYRTIDFSVPGFMTLSGATIVASTPVVFERTESRWTLDVDWTDGANITDENLNSAQLQSLRLVQEALDGRFEGITQDIDMVQHRLKGLPDPVADDDAATKEYVDEHIQTGADSAAAAAVSAAAALASQTASAGNAGTATTKAAEAVVSAAAAAASAAMINLPAPVASTYLKRLANNLAYQVLTPAQVLADITNGGLITDAMISTPGIPAAGISAAKLMFLQMGANSVAQTVGAKLAVEVSLEDYGGVGDNSTLNDTAFARANTYLNSVGGGVIRLGRGIYRIAAIVTLSSKVSVIGEHYASTIRTTGAAVDMLSLGGNCIVRGVTFDSTVTRTTANAIRIDSTGQALITENLFLGHVNTISTFGACSLVWILDNSIYKATAVGSTGIRIGVTTPTGNDFFIRDNFIRGNDVVNQGNAGISILNSGGTYMSGNSVLWCATGLSITPAAGVTVTWTFSTNDTFDTGTVSGIVINPAATGSVRGTFLDGPWCSTNAVNGILLTNAGGGSIDGVDINNPRVFNNTQDGIKVLSGTFWSINGGAVAGNGNPANTYDAITVGAGITDFSIIGVHVGPGYGFGASHRYGVNVSAGASNNYIIMGCRGRGNISGNINDLGTGTSKQVGGNDPDWGMLDRPQAPATKTANYTVLVTDTFLIINQGSTCTLTLPAATAALRGKTITVKTLQAFTVVSASSNVAPITSATLGTAILPATAGAWADLVCDGSTGWIIMRKG